MRKQHEILVAQAEELNLEWETIVDKTGWMGLHLAIKKAKQSPKKCLCPVGGGGHIGNVHYPNCPQAKENPAAE